MDARTTRIREQAQSATQGSAAVPSPAGIPGGDVGDDGEEFVGEDDWLLRLEEN